jgi:hypothetical protein
MCQALLISHEFLRVVAVIQLRDFERVKKLEAAKRALALANKLKNPASRKKHKSRILSAMNKLRVAV